MYLLEPISSLDIKIQTVIISSVLGLFAGLLGSYIKHILLKISVKHKFETEYVYEQKKKLRDLIGVYYGRFLESAEQLNHRLMNLHINKDRGWLNVNSIYNKPNDTYYFSTTVYRFLAFQFLIRKFSADAIYIDSRIAEQNDLLFLKFIKALESIMTDVTLFVGHEYDFNFAIDHFLRDDLRLICEEIEDKENNKIISIKKYYELLEKNDLYNFMSILQFFDGLCQNEKRFRWDRLVSFHLLLICFINNFGYDMQKTDKKKLNQIAQSIINEKIHYNFVNSIIKVGLKKNKYCKRLIKILYEK